MANEPSGKGRTGDERVTQAGNVTGEGRSTADAPDRQGVSDPADGRDRNADDAPDPNTQAGAPLPQEHVNASLNTAGELSGRARDEGPDAIERTEAQRPKRDPDGLLSTDMAPADRETL